LDAHATAGVAEGFAVDSGWNVTVGPSFVVYGQGLYGDAVDDATEYVSDFLVSSPQLQ
jgi:hypothetical protein